MIWQAIPYIVFALILISFSRSGDRAIAEMSELTKRHGSHPKRIETTLSIKGTQKWLDRGAVLIVALGLAHVSYLAGLWK